MTPFEKYLLIKLHIISITALGVTCSDINTNPCLDLPRHVCINKQSFSNWTIEITDNISNCLVNKHISAHTTQVESTASAHTRRNEITAAYYSLSFAVFIFSNCNN